MNSQDLLTVSNTQANSPQGNNHTRDFNADVIRVLAFTFIPCAHFFLYTGFYDFKIVSPIYMILLCIRNLFLLCLPLFMLLTGYLQGDKKLEPNKKYYSKIWNFLIPYLITSLLILLYNAYINKSIPSVVEIINGFTTYSGYSWYVELYTGLFLLIPFLNMIWANLKTKKQELTLIGILLFLSVLPTITNVYDFSSANWFNTNSTVYTKLLPNYWIDLYPLTFYFTGAYIKKHKDEIKLKPSRILLLFVGAFILVNVYCIAKHYGKQPSISSWVSRNSFLLYILAVLLFTFIISIKFKKVPAKLATFTSMLSALSLSAYLCSYLVDQIVYHKFFNKRIPYFSHRLPWFPVVVLGIIIISFIAAFFVNLCSGWICKLFVKPTSTAKGKKNVNN